MTADAAQPQRVLVTGASGFVGRHVCAALSAAGFRVRALLRNPAAREALGKSVDSVHLGSVTDVASLDGAAGDCAAIVHLVGIINEAENTFEHIHVDGTRNVLREANRVGVRRFVYLSGLGARPDAPARYHQTKAAAEKLVAESVPEGYSFQASIIFGPEDDFLNLFVKFARNRFDLRYPPWPIMPLIAGGRTLLQPIWVGDVAAVLTRACAPDFPSRIPPGVYQLGGPEALSVRQIMNVACAVAKQKRVFVNIPLSVARVLAMVLEKTSSHPLLTRDQLAMLTEDGRAHANATARILGRPGRRLWDYAREDLLGQPPRVEVGA